jgi:hypothetical protein
MTVRSVDLQVVVQKSAEIMRSQQNENSKTRLQLQHQAQQLQQKGEIDNRQVKTLQRPDKSAINENKERGGKKRQNNEKGGKAKEGRQESKGSASTIDIKI